MRKNLALFLALMLVITLFAGCAKKEETPPAQPATPPAGSQTATQQPQGTEAIRGSKAFVDLMQSGSYQMKFRIKTQVASQTVEVEVTQAVKGDMTALSGTQAGIGFQMLLRDGKAYMIDHSSKKVFALPGAESADSVMFDDDQFEFVSSGKEEFQQKELGYDEYQVESGSVRIYYDGDTIVGMKMISESADVQIEIVEITDKVDDSLFELPKGYDVVG